MYLALKTLHIIAIISWMAGVLYLYRLLIYHTENIQDASRCELLEIMSRKLYRYIAVPAMATAWIAALIMLVLNTGFLSQGWLHAKLLFVVMLTFSTTYAAKIMRKLEQKETPFTSKQLRFLNEVPTLLMIVIVILVVFKPF